MGDAIPTQQWWGEKNRKQAGGKANTKRCIMSHLQTCEKIQPAAQSLGRPYGTTHTVEQQREKERGIYLLDLFLPHPPTPVSCWSKFTLRGVISPLFSSCATQPFREVTTTQLCIWVLSGGRSPNLCGSSQPRPWHWNSYDSYLGKCDTGHARALPLSSTMESGYGDTYGCGSPLRTEQVVGDPGHSGGHTRLDRFIYWI